MNEFEIESGDPSPVDADTCTPGERGPCYTGPAGTEGVGPCHAGTRTCDTEGQWRPCEDETLPAEETCSTDFDDDCDGLLNEAGPDCGCMPGSTRDCYGGPMGTQGVGTCKSGQQTCNPDGNGYGNCDGQVLPAAEVCGTAEDEDCDGEGVFPDTDCVCAPGTTQPCYSGPPATDGVGQCMPGTETCNPDGLGWSGCAGEVLPATENCGTPADEDCDGAGWYTDDPALTDDSECVCQPNTTTQTCYTGPPGTEGVGACQAGTATCNADGLTFGACMGQVIPAAEVCGANLIDENCDGSLCGGDVLWAFKAGGDDDQLVTDVAVDSAGNVIVVGEVQGNLVVDGTTYSSGGATDAFVIKLDPAGTPLWVKRFGPGQDQRIAGVALDAMDNVYVVGEFNGSITLSPTVTLVTTANSDRDIFLAKLDPQGALAWAVDFGDSANQYARGIDVIAEDDIVFTGQLNGSITTGTLPISDSGSGDAFVVRWGNNAGMIRWIQRFGESSAPQIGNAIAAGNGLYVTGAAAGSFMIGSSSIQAGNNNDALCLRLDAVAGAASWADSYAGLSDLTNHAGLDITLDPSGNFLVTGQFDTTIDLGGGILNGPPSGAGFVVKFSSTGQHLWSKSFGGTGPHSGKSIATDSAGNVLLTGNFSGTANFGGPTLTASGTDLFIAKLDPSGNHLWSRRFGDAAVQLGTAIAATPDDHAIAAGHFKGTLDFGTTTLTANGTNQTLFLAKLYP